MMDEPSEDRGGVSPPELQWVKKLPQCLHILERLAWCERMM
jgi:hypothetical protein